MHVRTHLHAVRGGGGDGTPRGIACIQLAAHALLVHGQDVEAAGQRQQERKWILNLIVGNIAKPVSQ